MESKKLKVNGMSCEHCVKAVSGALGAIDSVADVVVSLKEGTVSFSHDPSRADIDVIKAAIKEEGFEVG
jgi:copper chaperone